MAVCPLHSLTTAERVLERKTAYLTSPPSRLYYRQPCENIVTGPFHMDYGWHTLAETL